MRAFNFVLEDTVEHRVREVLETKLAIIAEEFGVDKAADVMDSVETEPLFDELFVQGLQNPDAIESECDAVVSQLRSTIAETRKSSELLSDSHELDADDARKWRDHPAQFWLERAITTGLPARGGSAVKEGDAWQVRWADGSESAKVCFDARTAEDRPDIEWVTLEDPRARAVISDLPRHVSAQPLATVRIAGLPDSVRGVWSLWEISLSAEDFSRRRFLSVFVNDEGRTFLPTAKRIHALQRAADDRLKEWLFHHYADLPSLPAAKGPVMVHHVPRYLALRRNAGEDRVALLVFDGLAMDQWIQIREYLVARLPDFSADEGGCFAWLPTLTSVSRQALFSGLKPREFSNSIETTSQEPSLWTRFWQENGLRKPDVVYQKGLKRTDQLADLEEAIARPNVKVAGIVVDMIDEIVHGAMLGKRGIAGQISAWCDTGFVEKLFLLLAEHGYQIYLTADHGNVDADGIGRINQGVVTELKGERVRTYRSEALAASVPSDIDAFRFDSPGLPPDFLPLYAATRGAFVPKGDQIVAHGGISVEELIVPFVKIEIAKRTS